MKSRTIFISILTICLIVCAKSNSYAKYVFQYEKTVAEITINI